MKIFNTILAILFVLAFVSVGIYLTGLHDKALQEGYAKYDSCVIAKYGISAASYYQEHGRTPDCE